MLYNYKLMPHILNHNAYNINIRSYYIYINCSTFFWLDLTDLWRSSSIINICQWYSLKLSNLVSLQRLNYIIQLLCWVLH